MYWDQKWSKTFKQNRWFACLFSGNTRNTNCYYYKPKQTDIVWSTALFIHIYMKNINQIKKRGYKLKVILDIPIKAQAPMKWLWKKKQANIWWWKSGNWRECKLLESLERKYDTQTSQTTFDLPCRIKVKQQPSYQRPLDM